jgi:integration host factor subunit beta
MALTTKERDLIKEAAELITRETQAGEKIILRGFGTFKQVTKKARIATNPATKEKVNVPERICLHFKPVK